MELSNSFWAAIISKWELKVLRIPDRLFSVLILVTYI